MSDAIPALLNRALSAGIAVGTRGRCLWGATPPGPAFLPVWLAVAGVALFVLRLVEARRFGGAQVHWPDKGALARVATVLGGLVAVPLLAPVVGLVLALGMFVAFLLLAVLRQPLWPSVVAVSITVGLVYAIFVGWLGVPLPKGLIGI